MKFTDFKGNIINLSEDIWATHILVNHPEISVQNVELTLKDPDEVWFSQHRRDVELYYRKKDLAETVKVRYWMVAVKKIPSGNFVSSAMSKSTIIGAELVYKKP